VLDAMRYERRRDAALAVARRDASALEPALHTRDPRQLPHADDAPVQLGDEEWPRAVLHPRVE
jgi:hypothetical protein